MSSLKHLTAQEVRDQMRAGAGNAGGPPAGWVTQAIRSEHPRVGPDTPDEALLAHAPSLNTELLGLIDRDGWRSAIMLSAEWTRGADGFGVGVGFRFAHGQAPAFVCLSSHGDDLTVCDVGRRLDAALAVAGRLGDEHAAVGYVPAEPDASPPWTRAAFCEQVVFCEQLAARRIHELAERVCEHVHRHGLPSLTSL